MSKENTIPRYEDLSPQGQEAYNSIQVTVLMSRWIYDAALKYGFTPNQAMQLIQTCWTSILGGERKC